MSRDKNNNIFEKTSFLGNNSSEFVETLYTEYLNDPNKLPNQWREFFEGLKDKSEKILQNANGPSWSPKKRTKFNNFIIKKSDIKENGNIIKSENLLQSAKDSVRANMLVRAFRIRGHLISNLDPLGLQQRQEHTELRPETYGFSKNDENKKIFMDGVLGIDTA